MGTLSIYLGKNKIFDFNDFKMHYDLKNNKSLRFAFRKCTHQYLRIFLIIVLKCKKLGSIYSVNYVKFVYAFTLNYTFHKRCYNEWNNWAVIMNAVVLFTFRTYTM